MAGKRKLFVDEGMFYSLDTSYTNVNGIWLNPMEFMVIHDGTTLGLQTLSLQNLESEEFAFAFLDLLTSIDGYTIDPTTNSIIFIVDKGVIDTEAKAKDYITGFLLNYQMETIEYYSNTDALYTMESYTASGVFLGNTQASSTSVLVSKMLNFDSAQSVNSESGYYYHTFRRALIAA